MAKCDAVRCGAVERACATNSSEPTAMERTDKAGRQGTAFRWWGGVVLARDMAGLESGQICPVLSSMSCP